MPVHVEEIVSDVTVTGGDLPLTEAQLERIAEFVIARIDRRERERAAARAATRLRSTSEPEVTG